MSRYSIETCVYVVIVQYLEVINAQPLPLLTNYFCGWCAIRFGYIFCRWIGILVNTKAYIPIPGYIFGIPMILNKN